MRATADFTAEVSDGVNLDEITVTFFKIANHTRTPGLIDGHFDVSDGLLLFDLLIDKSLDLGQLFRSHLCRVREIEPQSFRGNIRALLMNVSSEHTS